MLLVDVHHGARFAIFATLGAGFLAEVAATYHGRRNVREAFGPRRGGGTSLDRGTKQALVLAMVGGLFAEVLIARDASSLRAGANTWSTFFLGLGVLWLGIGLRVWAVWSLGRYFRREVTIEAGQTVHTSGPYRWLRHPAYLGDLLIVFGFGLAWGSWIGAAIGTAIAFAGHLPRIRVEEDELRRAFGESYASFARGRARLVPGVW